MEREVLTAEAARLFLAISSQPLVCFFPASGFALQPCIKSHAGIYGQPFDKPVEMSAK